MALIHKKIQKMNKLITLTLFFIATHAYSQQQNENTKLKESFESVIGKSDKAYDSVFNNSFTAAGGEKFLRLSIIVNKSLNEVWNTIATENGLKKWIAPVVSLDLKVGGTVKTNYNEAAKIGDNGTITLGIMSYLPNEMLILKVTLNDNFAEKCRNEDKNLHEIIQLKPLGDNRTMITSTMEGWGQGKEWDETYGFFEKGNKWTFQELLNSFKK